MRIRVIPYRKGSRGAKSLAHALGGKRLRFVNSRYRRRPTDILINWGSSGPPHTPTLGNDPFWVKHSTNKLLFFDRMRAEQVSIPDYWRYGEEDEIPDEAFPIVCRTILTGHSGAGIVIANNRDELVPAPLYVQYIKKKDEYRIHCGWKYGEPSVISVQRKARRNGHENPDWQIRNNANGFVYVREGVNPPVCVIQTALDAFNTSNLHFGAVDVIYNEKQDKAYCLEINTAPGLQGQTILDYANFFKELVDV